MVKNSNNVVVIGAGIVGVSTAIHLQRKGLSVTLIDKNDPGAETSYGNSGIIESSFVLPFSAPKLKFAPRILTNRFPAAHVSYPSAIKYAPWILKFFLKSKNATRIHNGALMRPLVENALDEHKFIMKNTDGMKLMSNHGRAAIYRTQSSFNAAEFERNMASEYGVPFEIFDANNFKDIEPNIKPNFYKAVSWNGSARYLNPQKAVIYATQKFIGDGGTFLKDMVSSLSKINNQWKVVTSSKTLTSSNVVICAGPWSKQILEKFGLNIPIAFKRGYNKHLTPVNKINHAIVDVDVGYLLVPMENAVRLTTGVEFGSMGARYSGKQIKQIIPKAHELFELRDNLTDNNWIGNRPCTTDSLPIIGEVKNFKGLWFNIGHGHSGITIAPSTGRLVSEMIVETNTFCDPTPYSIDRFN